MLDIFLQNTISATQKINKNLREILSPSLFPKTTKQNECSIEECNRKCDICKNVWQQMHFTLRRAHQHYLFMNSKHHKSNAFHHSTNSTKVLIQLIVVTYREIYMRTQAVCPKHLNVER